MLTNLEKPCLAPIEYMFGALSSITARFCAPIWHLSSAYLASFEPLSSVYLVSFEPLSSAYLASFEPLSSAYLASFEPPPCPVWPPSIAHLVSTWLALSAYRTLIKSYI